MMDSSEAQNESGVREHDDGTIDWAMGDLLSPSAGTKPSMCAGAAVELGPGDAYYSYRMRGGDGEIRIATDKRKVPTSTYLACHTSDLPLGILRRDRRRPHLPVLDNRPCCCDHPRRVSLSSCGHPRSLSLRTSKRGTPKLRGCGEARGPWSSGQVRTRRGGGGGTGCPID